MLDDSEVPGRGGEKVVGRVGCDGAGQAARRGALAYRAQVEFARPVRLRERGGLVPVVERLVEKQYRHRARLEEDEAVRHVRERNPGLEWRVGAKRICLIVEERLGKGAGVNQQPRVWRGFERLRR